MARVPVAVVGVGHLGQEHARVLAGLPGAELVGVVDADAARAEQVAARCGTRTWPDHHALAGATRAAVIATPTLHHHAVARDLLAQGVHLLVEKPLASNVAQARELVEMADRRGALLQVGHIERFNPAFEELRSRPFRPRYITSERCGGFTGRSTDVGVVLDLMIHDLDLVLALVQAPVARVEAMGASVLGGHEDMAQARVTFANGCVADLSASRVHPEAVRRLRAFASEGHATVDFARRHVTLIQPAEALRQRRFDSRRLDAATLASLKSELFTRYFEAQEVDCTGRHKADQLTRELEEFVECVRSGGRPRVDGRAGLAALELADQVLTSLRGHAWEGRVNGPVGPRQLPAPHGWLFPPARQEAA
jgi:predicted dehydrogenase